MMISLLPEVIVVILNFVLSDLAIVGGHGKFRD